MVGIGFFAPLPLALMMPFMAGQSLLMGEAFGKGFQFGKRKISSMTNDDFNALTAKDLGQQIATDYNDIIPSLEQAVKASSAFQSMIIQEMGVILKSIPDEILKFFGLEGLGGGEDNLLNFNLQQIKLWTIKELRAAFENSFHLYNAITQILITQEYKRRVTGTQPPPPPNLAPPKPRPIPPPPTPTPTPTPTPKTVSVAITFNWALKNAQGRIFTQFNKSSMLSNQNNKWVFVKTGTKQNLVRLAILSWPSATYEKFSFGPKNLFWTKKSKMPRQWHIQL